MFWNFNLQNSELPPNLNEDNVSEEILQPNRKTINIITINDCTLSQFHTKIIKKEGKLFIGDIESKNGIRKKLMCDEKIIITSDLVFYFLDNVFFFEGIYKNKNVNVYKMKIKLGSKEIYKNEILLSFKDNLSLSPFSKDVYIKTLFTDLLKKNGIDLTNNNYLDFPLITFDFPKQYFILYTPSQKRISDLFELNIHIKLEGCKGEDDSDKNYINLCENDEFHIGGELVCSLKKNEICLIKHCQSASYDFIIKDCNHYLCEGCLESLTENKCPICNYTIVDYIHKYTY